jgi:hypothetical protein
MSLLENYLRITQTGSAPQWWSVADLRIYG